MGNETGKNRERRKGPEWDRIFSGKGIDIGCGSDPIFPDCDKWDKDQGDATYMKEVPSESYDWVHSSHCLEHLQYPFKALCSWWRILKPEGHLIVTVPDFFLYEKKQWPSAFNRDHKHKFSLQYHPNTTNILTPFKLLLGCQIRWVRLNDEGFDYSNKITDQTVKGAQSEIEIVAKKMKDTFWTE